MKGILMLVLGLAIGCSSAITGMLRLQDREILIHPDKAALAFPHKKDECKKRKLWFGSKCKKVQHMDIYDMNKKEDRMKLINAGFTCKSPMRFNY